MDVNQLAHAFLNAMEELTDCIERGEIIGTESIATGVGEIEVRGVTYQIQITLAGDKSGYLPEDAPVVIEGYKMVKKEP